MKFYYLINANQSKPSEKIGQVCQLQLENEDERN